LTTPELGDSHTPIIVDVEFNPKEWESFWPGAVNGTLFNSLQFLSYHPPERFQSQHIVFRRKGNIVGLFPAVLVTEKDEALSWISHPGASYGGPVWSPKLHYHHLEQMAAALVEYARGKGFNRIRLTPPPVIYSEHPEQALPFALLRQGFSIVRTELTQAVRLDFKPESLAEGFVNKTRTAFRRAQREGLTFRLIDQPTAEELDRFWEILVVNRAGLGVVPAHSREEIERLHNLIPERLMLAIVEYKSQMIAVIWNFLCNKRTVLEFYMAHLAEYQHLRPVPFLTYHSLLWAHKQGYRYLDFGISSIWGEPTWGLLKFKENFYAQHYLRQTYQIELKTG